MTDWEKAVAHWLPKVWTPGRRCYSVFNCPHSQFKSVGPDHRQIIEPHDISCPPATPELGFRLLEAMKGSSRWMREDQQWLVCGYNPFVHVKDPDLLTAVIGAAAALAEKETHAE